MIATACKLRLTLLGATLVAGGSSWMLLGARDRGVTKAAHLRPLSVAARQVVQQSGYETRIEYLGTVVARRQSELGFEHRGRLAEVLVRAGATVKAGDVLARLDQQRIDAQIEVLRSQQREAEARLAELQAGPRAEVIAASRARALAHQQELESLRLRTQRQRQLRERNLISASDFDALQYQTHAQEARAAAAQAELDELLAGTRPEQIATQRAIVDGLHARQRAVQIDRDRHELRAPFDAKVVHRAVDEGTILDPGQPVLQILEDAAQEVRVGVPREAAESFAAQRQHRCWIGEHEFTATANRVVPALDPHSQTVGVILQLEADHTPVFAGEVARIQGHRHHDDAGFWLPLQALTRSYKGLWSCFALVEEHNSAPAPHVTERREVEILHLEDQKAYVRGTLRDGDLIVENGCQRIVPGQRVALAANPTPQP